MSWITKYHRWRYERLWKVAKDKANAVWEADKENYEYKPSTEYLSERLQARLEHHGYRWWLRSLNSDGIVDLTNTGIDKFKRLPDYLEKKAVDEGKGKIDLFGPNSPDSFITVTEDKHIEVTFGPRSKHDKTEYMFYDGVPQGPMIWGKTTVVVGENANSFPAPLNLELEVGGEESKELNND
jgi:hypothetical protein